MSKVVEYWVIKIKEGEEDSSWQPQGPYTSRKAARKYRDACINVALRLKELGEGETFTLKEREIGGTSKVGIQVG